jgi:hypothetical protein
MRCLLLGLEVVWIKELLFRAGKNLGSIKLRSTMTAGLDTYTVIETMNSCKRPRILSKK